jgi:hypothetical protein
MTSTVAGLPPAVEPRTLSPELREDSGNVYFAGPMGMEATYDRVLVLEDEFRSGYECEICNQVGSVMCRQCGGKGSYCSDQPGYEHVEKKCSDCDGTGKKKCSDCNGTGALIHIPDSAKRRPTTGLIVSLGCDVKEYHRGEYAAYPNFCGEVWELSGLDASGVESTIVLRMMKEKELLCRVTGHLSLKRMKNRAAQITG